MPKRLPGLSLALLFSLHVGISCAQDSTSIRGAIPSNIGITVSFGYGLDRFKTGLVTEDEEENELTISPGGGIGIGVCLNTTFKQKWIIGHEFNYQFTSFIPQAKNAEGHFNHLNYQLVLKRAIPLEGEPLAIVFGAGTNVSIQGKYDFDLRKVPNGAHNIYRYKTTMGPCLLIEYLAWFDRKSLGGIAGIKYTYLKYKLESLSSNGYDVPLDQSFTSALPSKLVRPFSSSIDLYITLIFSF